MVKWLNNLVWDYSLMVLHMSNVYSVEMFLQQQCVLYQVFYVRKEEEIDLCYIHIYV